MNLKNSEEFIKDVKNSKWINSSNWKKIVEQFLLYLNSNVLIGNISYHLKDEEENNYNSQSNQINYYQFDSDYISTNYSSKDFPINSTDEIFNYGIFENANINNISSDEDNISKELYFKFKSIPEYDLRIEVLNIFMELFDIEYTLTY